VDGSQRAPLQAWMHRHGCWLFLVLGLVCLVRGVVFANSKYGYIDPVVFALAAFALAGSGWFFSRRSRP
jgi:uncharacterized membrane protein